MPRERVDPSSVLVDWEMIDQAAQAIVHDDLLQWRRNARQTKRQATWANPKIKESSTQALVV